MVAYFFHSTTYELFSKKGKLAGIIASSVKRNPLALLTAYILSEVPLWWCILAPSGEKAFALYNYYINIRLLPNKPYHNFSLVFLKSSTSFLYNPSLLIKSLCVPF